MLRQDDAIASLMQDWSQQQGLQPSSGEPKKAEEISEKRARKRKLPELPDYPNNTFLAGSHSIWNPYVQPVPLDDGESSSGDSMSPVISTNPQVEVVRRRAYEAFKKDCLEVIQRTIQQPFKVKFSIPSVVEKWHMDAKHKERGRYEGINSQRYPIMATTAKINAWTRQNFDHYFDPMLLSNQSAPLLAPLLKEEIIRAWKQQKGSMETKDAPHKLQKKLKQVHKAIYRIIERTRENFAKQLQQVANQSILQTSKTRKQPKITRVDEDSLIQVTFAGNSFRIHPAYHEKLQRLYDRQQQRRPANDDFSSEQEYTFEEALFCMLCRYDMLQGAGLQAGVPGSIMDTLLDKLDCRMECFASPLNCRYETFASAFELDILFGSQSSFFHLSNLPSGCYQANPPFCDGVIGALSQKMDIMFRDASEPLMFVVFVPAWKDSKSYQLLLSHKYLSKHLLLEQGNHWYAEGTQHRRQDSFRVASFDTSVLFYQNNAAKESWPVDDPLLEGVREAFCQDPGRMDKQITSSPNIRKSTSQKEVNASSSGGGNSTTVETRPAATKRAPKKANRGKKRVFAGDEEENAAHLDVLRSLGIVSKENEDFDEYERKETQKVVDFGSKKKRRKQKKKKAKA